MLRALCLTIPLLLLPASVTAADADSDLGANAALKYWQGFAALPSFADAEQKQLGECLTMSLDAHAREAVTRARYALTMVQRGAALPRCDWGIGYEEGVGTLLPHAAAARLIANLACLRARLSFEEGRNAEAIDDVFAVLVLGRRVSLGGINSMVLTSYAIEHQMSEVLALYLPRLDAPALRAVKLRLGALPPRESPAAALKVEEHFALDWLVGQIRAAIDRDSLLALLAQLCGSPEKARAFLRECGGSADGVLKVAAET